MAAAAETALVAAMSAAGSTRGTRRSRAKKGKARRVLLQRVGGIDDFGSRDKAVAPATSERLAEDGYMFNTHPIVRLTNAGIDWGRAPEPGDEIGYGMHPYRQDDCLAAAIATCIQVPIEQVPYLALDQRFQQGESREEISRSGWERIEHWVDKLGGEMRSFDELPLTCERWIGVIVSPASRDRSEEEWRALRAGKKLAAFQDHCVVMRRDRLLFDPSCSVRLPTGAIGRFVYGPSDTTYGIAFIDKEK